MKNGSIEQIGNHNELSENSEIYKEILHLQQL